MHVKDLVDVDQKDSLSMKGINRYKDLSIKGRKATKQTQNQKRTKVRINETRL